MRHRPLAAFLAALLPILLLTSCSSDDPTAPEPTVVDLTVTPAQGAPGAMVALSGFEAGALVDEELEATVGDRTTTARVAADGSVLIAVPVFVDSAAPKVVTPTGPQTIQVRRNGTLVGEAKEAFTVTELPSAPGAVTEVSDALTEIVDNLRRIALQLEPNPSPEQAFAIVTLEAVADVLGSDSPQSMASQLELLATDDPSRELLEGVIASSGMLTQLQEVAEQSGALVEEAQEFMEGQNALHRTTTLLDRDLAWRMQFYTMMHDFGSQVLGETVSTWGATVGVVSGAVGLVVSIPYVGQVSAILGLANFALNNVALAYLPAKVDNFELELVEDYVRSGQVANTRVWIEASNDPVPITILDFVDLVLTAMGTAASTERETLREILADVANYFLDRIRQLMSAYAGANPGAGVATDVGSIPPMTWRAEVIDARFAEPKTFSPGLIDPTSVSVKWRAGIEAEGEGRIYASIKHGPESLVIAEIPGYEYNAGAFGEDIRNTETMTVVVGSPLEITATIDPIITPGGQNGLEVRAGVRNALDDLVWTTGIEIELTSAGGAVNPATGVTDAEGRFNAFVTLEPNSTEVSIDVVARREFGPEARSTVVTALAPLEIDVVEWSQQISSDSPTPLRLRVHRADEPVSGATVSLAAIDASATPPNGSTDANGEFSAQVTADPEASSVVVEVVAVDRGQEATTELGAVHGNSGGDVLATSVWFEFEVTASGCCNDPPDPQFDSDEIETIQFVDDFSDVGPVLGFDASGSVQASAGGSSGDGSGSAMGSHASSLLFDGQGNLTGIAFAGEGTASFSQVGASSGGGTALAYIQIGFDVVGDATTMTLTANTADSQETYLQLEGPAGFHYYWSPTSGTPLPSIERSDVLVPGSYTLSIQTRANSSYAADTGSGTNVTSMSLEIGFGQASNVSMGRR